jgi:hypothetical protein
MDYDIVFTPSELAKICLNCEKRRCCPDNCTRYKQMRAELKKLHRNRKNKKAGGKFKNEGIK